MKRPRSAESGDRPLSPLREKARQIDGDRVDKAPVLSEIVAEDLPNFEQGGNEALGDETRLVGQA